jgi:hypothetical protein
MVVHLCQIVSGFGIEMTALTYGTYMQLGGMLFHFHFN